MTGWWWWVDLPRALARRYLGLSAIAVDGHVLLGLGPLSGLLPPLALLAGAYVGAEHPGFDVTFTESLTLMLVILAIGTVSTLLGALATLGFALGDFFVNHSQWTTEPTLGGFFGDEPSGLIDVVAANGFVQRVDHDGNGVLSFQPWGVASDPMAVTSAGTRTLPAPRSAAARRLATQPGTAARNTMLA